MRACMCRRPIIYETDLSKSSQKFNEWEKLQCAGKKKIVPLSKTERERVMHFQSKRG